MTEITSSNPNQWIDKARGHIEDAANSATPDIELSAAVEALAEARRQNAAAEINEETRDDLSRLRAGLPALQWKADASTLEALESELDALDGDEVVDAPANAAQPEALAQPEAPAPDQSETPPNPEKKEAEQDEASSFMEDPAAWFKRQTQGGLAMLKKASSPGEWLKAGAAIVKALAAGFEYLKDYVGSTIGSAIASFKEIPGLGSIATGFEQFLGKHRYALFGALSAAGIGLTATIASYARKQLDGIERTLQASKRGFSPEQLAARFVALLEKTGIKAENAGDATKEQIDAVRKELEEEVQKKQLPEEQQEDAAEKGKEEVVKTMIENKELILRRDGSLEVDEKKWRLQTEGGQPIRLSAASINATSFSVTNQTTLKTISIPDTEWPKFFAALSENNDTSELVPMNDNKVILKFVRETV